MSLKMARWVASSVAVTICVIMCPACDDKSSSNTNDNTAEPSSPPAVDGLVLNVVFNELNDDGEWDQSYTTYPDPNPELIEEKVRGIDWREPRRSPFVSVNSSLAKGVNQLHVEGGLGTPNEDGLLRAYWSSQTFHRQSPPLDSLDEAIELLVSFYKQDQRWKTLVEWVDVD